MTQREEGVPVGGNGAESGRELGLLSLGELLIQVHFRVCLGDQRFHGLTSTPFGSSNGPIQLDHDPLLVSFAHCVFAKDPLLHAFNVSRCRPQIAGEYHEELIAAPSAYEVT